jgi:hypothetical protein
MTDTSRLDSALSGWLAEEAAVRAPQRLVHETRARIAATPQRRVMRGPLAWPRSITWRPLVTLGVIGVLVLAVASLSVYLARNGPAQSTSPAPTPSPVPTLTAVQPFECERARGTCLGPLTAGVYQTTTFEPRVRFSVSAGWSNLYDVPGQFDLSYDAGGQYTYPDGITFSDSLSMFANPVAESATNAAPLSGVGTSAADLASWLAAHQDLVATTPKGVEIGGATGFMLEISLPSGPRSAPDHCTTDHGEPRCESLFVGADPQANYGFGLVGPESAVVYLLDVPGGGTVLLAIDDVDGVDAAGLIQAATPIVESLDFTP